MADENILKKNEVTLAMEKDKVINGIWISDNHLLNPRSPTKGILANMSEFFYNQVDLTSINLIIFGGDVFHQLAENTKDPEFLAVMEWFKEFFLKCLKYDISVYILEGTSSHDWGQAKHLDIWKPVGSNVHYIDKVTVVKDRKLNISILFVPDNMGTISTDQIWEKVITELASSGLSKVDITAMHGAFDYQLPPPARKHCHNQNNYESITTFVIFAGHIHTPSSNGKVKVSGSFDRIAHGEEHPKGAFIFKLDKTRNKFTNEFYHNKNALPFITFNLWKDITLDELHSLVDKKISETRIMGAWFKFKDGPHEIVNAFVERLKDQYPYFNFEVSNKVDNVITIDDALFDDTNYKGSEINKDNITDLLFKQSDFDNCSEEELDYLKEVFKEHL